MACLTNLHVRRDLIHPETSAQELAPPMATTTFNPAVLVPRHEPSQLVLMSLAAAFVPPRSVGDLLPLLSQACPLSGLRHIKRVRKAPSGLLEVIICRVLDKADPPQSEQLPAPHNCDAAPPPQPSSHPCSQSTSSTDTEHTFELSQLEEGAASILSKLSLKLHLVQCAAEAPETRDQWAAWNKIWPITWHVPEIAKPLPGAIATPEEHAYFSRHMQSALSLAHQHGVANAAIIVDPATGEIVASAHDQSTAHPLQHAIMVAIARSATRDMQLWPENVHVALPALAPEGSAQDNQDAGQSCSAAAAAASQPASARAEEATGQKAKRARKSPAAVSDACEKPATLSHQEGLSAEGTDIATMEGKLVGARLRQYLCTGYDLFTVSEPCVMCAMAMVHSRVRIVVFTHKDTQHGALGGRLKLHAQGSLNHHYRVFHMPPSELKSSPSV